MRNFSGFLWLVSVQILLSVLADEYSGWFSCWMWPSFLRICWCNICEDQLVWVSTSLESGQKLRPICNTNNGMFQWSDHCSIFVQKWHLANFWYQSITTSNTHVFYGHSWGKYHMKKLYNFLDGILLLYESGVQCIWGIMSLLAMEKVERERERHFNVIWEFFKIA